MSLLAVNALRTVSRRSFSIASVVRSGGDEGAIRGAGGVWGEKEAAAENVYFRKVEAEQLEALRKKHNEEIDNHEKQIKAHLESIKRHREEVEKLHKHTQQKK